MLPDHAVNEIIRDCYNAASLAGGRITSQIQDLANEYARPSIMLHPQLSIDGDQWCCLYGDNLQNGVAGFGDSPDKAYRDFDKNWYAEL